jgi:hypothetical protein
MTCVEHFVFSMFVVKPVIMSNLRDPFCFHRCTGLGVVVLTATLCYFVLFSKKKTKSPSDDKYQTSSSNGGSAGVVVGGVDGKGITGNEPDLIIRSPTHQPLKMDKSGEIDSVTELDTLPESYSYYPRGNADGGVMMDGYGVGQTPSPRTSQFMMGSNGGVPGTNSHFISASELLAEHERRKSYSVNGGYGGGATSVTATAVTLNADGTVEAVYANFDPRTKTYGSGKVSGIPPPEYTTNTYPYDYNNGGTAVSGYYPHQNDGTGSSSVGGGSDASSHSTAALGGYVPMYPGQNHQNQQQWIGYEHQQYGSLPSPNGGSNQGTLGKGPPPQVPPKPRGPPILDESHSSSGSDRKIWTATQV